MAQAISNAVRATETIVFEIDREDDLRFAIRQILNITERNELEAGGLFALPDGAVMEWQAALENTKVLDLFELTLSLQIQGLKDAKLDDPYQEKFYLWRPYWSTIDERSKFLSNKKS